MDAELARMETPRHPELSERSHSAHSHQGSGDRWEVRPSYWESNNGDSSGNPMGTNQPTFQAPPPQNQQQQSNPVGGAPLQRAIELPGGIRLMQGRRSGIFGGSQQRGAFAGSIGRGVSALSVPIPPPSSGLSVWGNLPASPAPQNLPDRSLSDRPWESPGPNLDLNR
jgi:hypothetical protein